MSSSNPAPHVNSSGNPPSNVCKFFLKGNCKHGDRCKRRHEAVSAQNAEGSNKRKGGDLEPVHLKAEETSLPVSTPENNTVSLNGDTVNLSKNIRSRKINKPCFAWSAGTCTRGDNCKYMHDPEMLHRTSTIEPVPIATNTPESTDTNSTEPKTSTGSRRDRRNRPRKQNAKPGQATAGAGDPNPAPSPGPSQHDNRHDTAQKEQSQRREVGEAIKRLPETRKARAAKRKAEIEAERKKQEEAERERVEQLRIQEEARRAAEEAEERRKAEEERAAELARQAERERQRKAAEERAGQLRIQREAEREEREARRRKEEEERAERLRIQQEARRAERNRREAAVTQRHVELGSTIVTFSAGVTIDHIVTGFESCRIQIKNLPFDAKHDEVCEMLRAQGVEEGKYHLVDLRKTGGQNSKEASFIVDGEVGRIIALGLDGIDFRGRALEFVVSNSSTIGGMNSASSSTVLSIFWRASSVRFVVTFAESAVADAKIRDFNGMVRYGRRIRVEKNRTRNGTLDPYSLLISGFAPQTSNQFIADMFQAPSEHMVRRLANAIEYDEDSAKVNITSLIRGRSPYCNIQFEGPSLNLDGNYSLRARFETWAEAKREHDMFHNIKFPWIGNSTFRLRLPDPVQYQITVPTQQYKAQKKQWETLATDIRDRKESFVRITEHQDGSRTFVRVGGDDSKAVGLLKVRVERLAAGHKLDIWHRSFGSATGKRFIESVHHAVGAYVAQDWRLKVVKVYGEPDAIAKAREMIMGELDRLASLEYTVPLKRQSIRFFVQHGIASLKETFGEDSVTLDISTSPCRITIRGGEDARHALSHLIEESLDDLAVVNPTSKDKSSTCPICLDEVSIPVQLGCGHEYCSACIRHFFTADIKNFPMLCIGNDVTCLTPIALPMIQRFLTPQQFKNLLETAFVKHVETNPQTYKYCPTPDCVQIYRRATDSEDSSATQVRCPSCLATICSKCQEEGHEGMTCEERHIQNDPAEQERLNEVWARQAGVKKCPQCSVWIEKTEGCNHMTCKCGAHVCWVCLGVFTAATIYDHMGSVHGGMYEDANGPAQVADEEDYEDYFAQARVLQAYQEQAVLRRREPDPYVPRPNPLQRYYEIEAQRRRNEELIAARRRRDEELAAARRAAENLRQQQEQARRNESSGWGCIVM